MKNLHRANSYHTGPEAKADPVESVTYSLRLLKSLHHVVTVLFIFLVTFLLFALTGPAFASAAKSNDRKSVIYKTPFTASLHDKERLLDWRSPVANLPFALPENDWIDEIELLISAQPEGRVSPTTPLLIRFNDAPAVPIYSDGNGFDARIKLDTSFLKGQGNRVRVEYQTPPGKTCLSAQNGVWAVNIEDSQIVIHARTKSRPPSLYDIKTRLKDPTTTPKSVAIIAGGPDELRLQALAAQGLSLNMDSIPNFRTEIGTSDLAILITTRDDLPKYVSEASIRKAQGPLIAASQTRSNLLIITGDTDADLLSAARTFATNPIPSSRQHALGPTGFYGANAFSRPTKIKLGKSYLGKIGLSQFDQGWRPEPQHIFFDVTDPASTSGALQLKFFMDGDVADTSNMHVTLNGETLGQFPVSGSRTVQTLDIPQGMLQGLRNHITLSADLFPQAGADGCRARQEIPRLSVSSKSILTLASDYPSAKTDLSRFAATGLPFAKENGAGTTLLIASNNKADREAALKLFAKLAQASGTGWADADILEATPQNWPTQGHVLVIGSDVETLSPVISTAPKSLVAAITGQSRQAPRLMKSAQNEPAPINLLSTGELISGGVAAIYRDTDNSDRLIGVITGSPGQSFSRSVTQLLTTDHWNKLEGSVSRWNQDTVLMAQTAISVDPQNKTQKPWTRVSKTVGAWFANIQWPDMSGVKDKVAGIFDKPKTSHPQEAQQVEVPTAPSLRTDNVAPVQERLASAVPIPKLKPNVPGAMSPTQNLNSLQSHPVLKPSFAPRGPSTLSKVKANVGKSYSATASRLSGFMNSIMTEQGYASKSNRPGVLLLSLLATLFLLIIAVCIPTRKE